MQETTAKQTEQRSGQKLFDVKDAAEYLRSLGAAAASINFVRALMNSRQISRLKIGKRLYATRESLDAWLQRSEKRARA